MAWVVDASVLLDIASNDARFASASATCLARHLPDDLVVCPVSYIELAPSFLGMGVPQQQFLHALGVRWQEPWIWQDTEMAHRLWNARSRKSAQAYSPSARSPISSSKRSPAAFRV